MPTFRFLLLLVAFVFLFPNCKEQNKDQSLANYNRTALLSNYYKNLIMPGFEQLFVASTKLELSINRLTANPTIANLEEARLQLDSTFLSWQFVQSFDFGASLLPSGSLKEEIGTFPTDTAQLLLFALASDTLFNNFRRDTRGLNALDFMLS